MFYLDEQRLAEVVKTAVTEAMAAVQTSTPAPEPQPEILHSIRELADFLGCTPVTAQRYKNEGRIPYKQVGRKVMFNTADVLRAIDSNKQHGRA